MEADPDVGRIGDAIVGFPFGQFVCCALNLEAAFAVSKDSRTEAIVHCAQDSPSDVRRFVFVSVKEFHAEVQSFTRLVTNPVLWGVPPFPYRTASFAYCDRKD
jgi:hypothetical protein